MGGIGQLHQQVTIGTLSDDDLLRIFKSFIDALDFYVTGSQKWATLVHVCRRWRDLAFTSPRHLNLQLLCQPPYRSVRDMLDIWPEWPIYVHDFDYKARDDVIAALKLNHRVSGIRLDKAFVPGWQTFKPLMQQPFPALTHLWILQPFYSIENAISRPFLGGSAPSLRSLILLEASFPALPELLLSTTNLVHLEYNDIPESGYISPEAMLTSLSTLTRLKILSLTFRSPQTLLDWEIRIPPPDTRTLLPALIYLRLKGDPEYVEDLVAQIDAPLLECIQITLFHQEVLEVSQLAKFVRRAAKLSLADRAEVRFDSDRISVTLSQERMITIVGPKTFVLKPACRERSGDSRLSYVAQFCASCLPTFAPFEHLHIRVPSYPSWHDVIDDQPAQWLEFLHLFNTVKDLRVSQTVAPCVAQALRGLPAERITEVLPALESVFISRLEAFGSVKEAISEFADMRQLSGHPVSISDWETREWSPFSSWDRTVDDW